MGVWHYRRLQSLGSSVSGQFASISTNYGIATRVRDATDIVGGTASIIIDDDEQQQKDHPLLRQFGWGSVDGAYSSDETIPFFNMKLIYKVNLNMKLIYKVNLNPRDYHSDTGQTQDMLDQDESWSEHPGTLTQMIQKAQTTHVA